MNDDVDLEMINAFIDILDDDRFSLTFFCSDEQWLEKIIDEMKDSLIDIYYNFDDRFINKFKECLHIYYDITNSVRFFFNMYIILKSYELQKKNFDNFNCIMDDIGFRIERTALLFQFESYFLNRKVIVDNIVGLSNYKELTNLRNSFLDILNDDHKSFGDLIDLIYDVSGDILKLEESGITVNHDVLLDIIDYRFDSSVYFNSIKYSSILLIGDRFKYINSVLMWVDSNPNFRNEIFSMIEELSIDLFSSKDKDLFMECMEKVFDSDSYYELISKMDSLIEASSLYENGKKEEAFSLINNLDNDCHKAFYEEKKVSYPNNTMNKITKPFRITDRMKQLYSRIDDSISYNFICQSDFNCSIRDVSLVIEKMIEKEKSPFTKVKKKIKKLVEKNV